MIEVEFKSYETEKTYNGLFQWDYGQILYVRGLSTSEIHFSRGDTALVVYPTVVADGITAKIPDVLLRDSGCIIAYIYLTDTGSGKTIKLLRMPVTRRARPEDYGGDEEGYSIYQRLLKQVDTKSDNISLSEGYLQLISNGVPIGDKVRLQASAANEVELRNNGLTIQWRYTNSNYWMDLISLEELRGPAGKTPKMERRGDHLYAIYE